MATIRVNGIKSNGRTGGNDNGPVSGSRRNKSRRTKGTAQAKRTKTELRANMRRWSHIYVALTVMLSSGLNGLANIQHAAEGYRIGAAVLGVLIPILVLILGRIASLAARAGNSRLALILGGIGCFVLLLSVAHCTQAISLLSGSHWTMSGLLAIGVDCGLVASEYTSIVE